MMRWTAPTLRHLEHYPILWDHLTGIILSRGSERLEMRCGASDEKRDAATGQKNPAFGGPERLIGCPESFWAALARHLGLGGPRIAPRAAPNRMSRSGPSNGPIRSDNALGAKMVVFMNHREIGAVL